MEKIWFLAKNKKKIKNKALNSFPSVIHHTFTHMISLFLLFLKSLSTTYGNTGTKDILLSCLGKFCKIYSEWKLLSCKRRYISLLANDNEISQIVHNSLVFANYILYYASTSKIHWHNTCRYRVQFWYNTENHTAHDLDSSYQNKNIFWNHLFLLLFSFFFFPRMHLIL